MRAGLVLVLCVALCLCAAPMGVRAEGARGPPGGNFWSDFWPSWCGEYCGKAFGGGGAALLDVTPTLPAAVRAAVERAHPNPPPAGAGSGLPTDHGAGAGARPHGSAASHAEMALARATTRDGGDGGGGDEFWDSMWGDWCGQFCENMELLQLGEESGVDAEGVKHAARAHMRSLQGEL